MRMVRRMDAQHRWVSVLGLTALPDHRLPRDRKIGQQTCMRVCVLVALMVFTTIIALQSIILSCARHTGPCGICCVDC